ncbi:MAG: hypothetical protein V1644_03815 [Candidatus Micrarchaeota archaeon]
MNQKATRIFTRALHGAVRAASTAAFRIKVFGRTLREINGIPLNKLTDQQLRLNAIRQNAFAVNVFGRHLPARKRQELLREINRKTLVVGSYRQHALGKAAIHFAGAVATFSLPPISGFFTTMGIGQVFHAFNTRATYNQDTNRIILEKKCIGLSSVVHEAAHFMQHDKVVNMPKTRVKSRAQKEEMASAAQAVQLNTQIMYYNSPDYSKKHALLGVFPVNSVSDWKSIKDPYERGWSLGLALAHLHVLPGGSKQRSWSMLHAISRGRITPEQAYEIAHRRYSRWQQHG